MFTVLPLSWLFLNAASCCFFRTNIYIRFTRVVTVLLYILHLEQNGTITSTNVSIHKQSCFIFLLNVSLVFWFMSNDETETLNSRIKDDIFSTFTEGKNFWRHCHMSDGIHAITDVLNIQIRVCLLRSINNSLTWKCTKVNSPIAFYKMIIKSY